LSDAPVSAEPLHFVKSASDPFPPVILPQTPPRFKPNPGTPHAHRPRIDIPGVFLYYRERAFRAIPFCEV